MVDSVQALDPIMLSNRTTLVITGGTSTNAESNSFNKTFKPAKMRSIHLFAFPLSLNVAVRSESAVSPEELDEFTDLYDLSPIYANPKVESARRASILSPFAFPLEPSSSLSFTARVVAPSSRTLMGVVCCASDSGCHWPLRQAIIRRSHRQC